MNIQEIFKELKKLNIPVVYGKFSKKPNSLPYLTISSPNSTFSGADSGVCLVENLEIEINLYTEIKNIDLECEILEIIMGENSISRSERYIDDEKIIENTFLFATTQKLYKE